MQCSALVLFCILLCSAGFFDCSSKVIKTLLDPLRMGDSAAGSQQALAVGLTDALRGVLDTLPPEEGRTLPTAAQVLSAV
jgi:hypothetical protein